MRKLAGLNLGLVAVVAMWAIGERAVWAAPIESMDGTTGYILTSDGTTATISFFSGQILSVGNVPFIPSADATLSTFAIDANTLQVTNFPLADAKVLSTDVSTQNGVFEFLDAQLIFNNVTPNTMVITGSEVLTQNTDDPALDLANFFDGGIFTFTLNTGTLSFIDLIQNGTAGRGLNGDQLVGTASFSEVIAPVPEPHTAILWAIGGLLIALRLGYLRIRKAAP